MDYLKVLANLPREEKGFGDLLATYNKAQAPSMKMSEYLDNNTGWVYACISAIADEIASINLKLYELSGDDIKEIDDHPALDTLYKANNFTTKFDLFWLITQYLKLAGEAPLFVVKNGNIPTQIYLLRPDRLTINAGEGEDFVSSYSYKNLAGKSVPIKADELIFIKQPDPRNPFRGMGTLQAAARVVDIENFSEEYNKNYFYNGASAGVIFQTDNKLSADQRDRLKTQIDQKYLGVGNAHKYLVLESGLKATPLQMSAKDMEFFNQLNWTRDKILGIFRVPRTALGITDDVNRANAEATDYVFAKRTIKPLMQMITEQLNEFYIPMFPDGENLWLDFEDPVPDDQVSKVNYYSQALTNGWLTINEVRHKEGYEDIENGDENFARDRIFASSFNTPDETKHLIDIKKKIFARNKKSTKKIIEKAIDNEIAEAVKVVKGDIKKTIIREEEKRDNEATQWSESKKEANWYAIIKRADRNEMRLRAVIAKQFRSQSEKLFGKKEKAVSKDKWLLDIEKESDIWVRVLIPVLDDIVREEGQATINELLSGKVFNNRDELVRDFIYKHTNKIAKDLNKNTNDSIKRILADNVDESEEVIGRKIRVMFDDMEVSRAKTIARTETFKAVNFATEEAYKQSDVVRAKRWFTGLDERVCEFCEPMHGHTFAVGSTIFDKGKRLSGSSGGTLELDYEPIQFPPLHTNCRCGLSPVLVGEKEYSKIKATIKHNDMASEISNIKDELEQNKKDTKEAISGISEKVEKSAESIEKISDNVGEVLKNG